MLMIQTVIMLLMSGVVNPGEFEKFHEQKRKDGEEKGEE